MCLGRFVLLVVLLLAYAAGASADLIRFKDGRTIRGNIMRRSAGQLMVMVAGELESIAASEIDSITYEEVHLAPAAPERVPTLEQQVSKTLEAFNNTFTEVLRQRVKVFAELARLAHSAVGHLLAGAADRALEDTRLAARQMLPVRGGDLDPYSALADIVILLGLRAPMLWLSMVLIRERRSYIRIAEYLVLSYLGMMALGSFSAATTDPLTGLALLAAALAWAGGLYLWMFGLSWPRSGTALGLAVALMLGADALMWTGVD
jgi:hypothetical protein